MNLHAVLAAWQGLRGWRRYGAALLLGVLLAGAQAPLSLWPLAFVSFILLLHLDDGGRDTDSRRRSFFTLFAFCYGYFVAGHYWIGISFFVDAAKYALLLPLPVLGLPIVLAVFPATGAWLARLSARGNRLAYMLLMPFGWLVGEWLRGHVATGFPWNLVGYVWGDWPAAMQLASYIGAQGLGLLTMLAASGMALALLGRRSALVLPALLVVAMGLASLRVPADIAMLPDVNLRLVQPSIEQTLKWQDGLRQQHLQQHVALSLQPPKANAEKPLTHVIWPETAIPYLLDEEPGLRDALAQRLTPGAVLITGAPRREALSANPRDITIYNSVFALDSAAQIAARYDKVHLVPFGEYLPFRSLLKPLGLDAIAAGAVDFSFGRDTSPIAIPGLPLARVLICYEAIFADESMRQSDAAPAAGLLLNLTNDAWFGRSSGPYQHFSAAKFRAVEQGLPLVRAANNGISAIVDPYGRVTVQLGLDEVGVVDGGLPAAIAQRPLYARIGDAPLLAFAIVSLIAAFVAMLRVAKH